MTSLKGICAIGLAAVAGAGFAVPGSIAGLYIARACMPGPISGEIVMGILVLGWMGGVMFGVTCGMIGFGLSPGTQRGWVLSMTLGVAVAASGTAALYGLLIAPRATVPEHSITICGIALTIGIGIAGGISALVSHAVTRKTKTL